MQPEIIIDDEFKYLLPPLDAETYAALEANLLQHGCRDALVLWDNILIDGHNRYEILSKHGLPFNTVNKDFDSREEVLIWIVSTQVARRNLSPLQLSHFRGLHYKADKKVQGRFAKSEQVCKNRHSDGFSESTATRLAEKYRVSPRTIERDAKIAAAIDAIGSVSSAAKRKILAGEVDIYRRELKELSSASEKKVKAIATAIEAGTFQKQRATAKKATGSSDFPASAIQTARKTVHNIQSELAKLDEQSSTAEIKTTLRSSIDQLEDLYRQL